MPNITIIGKEGHNVLQQTTANEVKITENSVVVIKVQKEDVKSMVQNGDALVITLKNGETIVIDNFFNNENLCTRQISQNPYPIRILLS